MFDRETLSTFGEIEWSPILSEVASFEEADCSIKKSVYSSTPESSASMLRNIWVFSTSVNLAPRVSNSDVLSFNVIQK